MSKNPTMNVAQIPGRTVRFFVEARDELRKVSWPSRETTIRYTIIVIVSSIAMGLFIGGLDYLFSLALKQII